MAEGYTLENTLEGMAVAKAFQSVNKKFFESMKHEEVIKKYAELLGSNLTVRVTAIMVVAITLQYLNHHGAIDDSQYANYLTVFSSLHDMDDINARDSLGVLVLMAAFAARIGKGDYFHDKEI